MKKYRVEYDSRAAKALKKMDSFTSKMIVNWIEQNLVDCENPRLHGKSLQGELNRYWRYRMGSYRILSLIDDGVVAVCVVEIGHGKEIY